MNPLRPLLASLAFAATLLAAPSTSRAAESYDNCAGTISSLPAVISTQGVWCLKSDLSTNITSGNAITIAANNVTIDCNDFKLGGLAAGNASGATGIYTASRQNITIRHCGIRGFLYGIDLEGVTGGGHLVEDNRLDNNLYVGIDVVGDNNLVRRNRIYDTGGYTGASQSYGIFAYANIMDNIVSGLFVDQGGGSMFGLVAMEPGSRVSGNVVTGFNTVPVNGGTVGLIDGINLAYGYIGATGNQVSSGSATVNGYGIAAFDSTDLCTGNLVAGFAINIGVACTDSGNLSPP